MIPKHLLSGIVVVVSLVFAANFAAPFFIPTYQADPAITGVFGVIAGAAFALAQRQNNKAAEGEASKPDEKPPEPSP